MTEVEETIRILDKCARRIWGDYGLVVQGIDMIWEVDACMFVGLKHHRFVGASTPWALYCSKSLWTGWDMLENLAVNPRFAAKLAEP